MVHRKWWKKRIEEAWLEKNVVWLSGVRRVGKTFLCRALPDIEYFDCELPRTRRSMDDPEGFLESLRDRRIVRDEIHRLQNPAQLLKIAADHFHGGFQTGGSASSPASRRFPPFFLSKNPPDSDFQEWIDAFWAKDIQELFRLQS